VFVLVLVHIDIASISTGLNRSQTYQVELIQSDPRVLWVDLSKVIVFNALP